MNKKERLEFFRALGKKGGLSTKKKYGSKHYKKLRSRQLLVEKTLPKL